MGFPEIEDYWFELLGKFLDACSGKECCKGCNVFGRCQRYWDKEIAEASAKRKLTKEDYDLFRSDLEMIISRKLER